jgi:hypothetical protein
MIVSFSAFGALVALLVFLVVTPEEVVVPAAAAYPASRATEVRRSFATEAAFPRATPPPEKTSKPVELVVTRKQNAQNVDDLFSNADLMKD